MVIFDFYNCFLFSDRFDFQWMAQRTVCREYIDLLWLDIRDVAMWKQEEELETNLCQTSFSN